MQQSDTNESIVDIIPGTRLRIEESAAVEDIFGYLLEQVTEERGDDPPTHDSLRRFIGLFLQNAGAEVAYQSLVGSGGAGSENSVFDVIASQGDQLRIVHVEATVSHSSLDTMRGHISALRASGAQGQLYIGIDVLSQFDLVSGTLRDGVKELMTDEGMGAILADELLVVVCDNYDQLIMDEMPTFLFPTG